jgi:hypothetical protein
MLLNALAAFEAVNSTFMTSGELRQCRKSNHQIVHGLSLPIHIDGQIVDAFFELPQIDRELRHIRMKYFDMSGKRLMPLCQPRKSLIDIHPLTALPA